MLQQWNALSCHIKLHETAVTGTAFSCHKFCQTFQPSHSCTLQAELERDTESLKKEVIDIRLLAQRDIVLDPQAEMLEVTSLPHVAKHQQSPAQDVLFFLLVV